MNNWKFPYYNEETGQMDWESLEKFDWISDMHGVEQDPIWHAEGDVYTHTKMVVEAILKLPEFISLPIQDKHILVTSALLHDVEKRSTTTIEDGHVRTHGHGKKGAKTANIILYKEFNAPVLIRRSICNLVRMHALPLNILERENPNREVVVSGFKVDNRLLGILSKADVLGRIANDETEQLEKIEYFIEYCMNNHCYYGKRYFVNSLARYVYLSKTDSYVDYEPHDESKFKVYVLSGIAGSGKDHTIKHMDLLKELPIVSLDDIRRKNGVSPTDKVGNGRVIQVAKELAKSYMREHVDFIWNATNITKMTRNQIIELVHSYGGSVTIIYVEKPYKKLLSQNKDRDYVVPENVIERMIGKLEFPEYGEAEEILIIG